MSGGTVFLLGLFAFVVVVPAVAILLSMWRDQRRRARGLPVYGTGSTGPGSFVRCQCCRHYSKGTMP